LAQKRDEVQKLIDCKAREREEIIEEEKQRLYRMEKEMMERH